MSLAGKRRDREGGSAGYGGGFWTVAYRLALMAHPREWRDRYLDEATEAFAGGVARRRSKSGLVALRYAIRALADAVLAGCRERMRAGRRAETGAKKVGAHRFLDTLRVDLLYAHRKLFKDPGFTLPVLITLALGIGANTAIFTVVDGVILKPLPYRDADRIIQVREIAPQGFGFTVSPPNFRSLRDQARSLEDATAYRETLLTLTGGEVPEAIWGVRVSAGFFEFLGAPPALGRSFLPEEDEAGAHPTVILSHGAWQRRFGGSPSTLGSTVVLDGVSRTIVGVLPRRFRFAEGDPEVWLPQEFTERDVSLRGRHFLQVLARLRPGTNLETALEEMRTIWSGLEEEYPETNTGWGVTAFPLLQYVVGGARTPLLVLLGAAGLVLLIACANVANLSLARVERRGREMAIRSALGGSRTRLIRQLLTEHLVLGITGGVLGLGLAYLAVDRLLLLFRGHLPRADDVGVNGAVLLFTFIISIGVGVLTGLAPVVQGTRNDLFAALRTTVHRLGEAWGRGRVRGTFVIVEVALALMLVMGTGLVLNSFVRLTRVDLGFQKENLLTGQILLPEARYQTAEERALFFQTLSDDLERHGEVVAAAAVGVLPLTGSYTHVFTVPGAPEDAKWQAEDRLVTPGYFRTMRIPLLAGRVFQETEGAGAPLVAVVNEALAHQLYPEGGAVGRRVMFKGSPSEESWEIVGVVGNTRQFGVRSESPPTLYRPHSQINPPSSMAVVVRASDSPRDLVATLREAVRDVDPALPIHQLSTMEDLVSASLTSERVVLILLGLFGFVAIVLGAVGIFGVMSYTVSQRVTEMGVRIALGGAPRDVLTMVVRQGMTLAALGVVLGMLGSLALGRLLTDVLYGVEPADPMTLGAVTALIALVSLAACILPARRAAAVDPAESLRSE
ncbi:MAG: ABC transporter permease [Gemmatimonadota bacterium]|nr:MAG: ABC transporter permease [Gemmatimonadota bacterium]